MNDASDQIDAALSEARAREAALREVLQIISQSRHDEGPVFEAVLKAATLRCGADKAGLMLGEPDGERLSLAALFEPDLSSDAVRAMIAEANDPPMRMDPGQRISAQAICTGDVVQIADLSESPQYLAGVQTFRQMVEEMGSRSVLCVPLQGDRGAIGAIVLHRTEVRPFADEQVSLVETFAAQAVIAIENVRQFRELQTRLQREAATREILEVISLHPDYEQPVFDAIMNSAALLCDAPHAGLMLRNAKDTHLLLVASNVTNSGYSKMLRETPHSMSDEKSLSVEAVTSMQVRQYADIEALKDYTQPSEQLKITWDLERMRTLLYVPLIKGDRAIGTLVLYRLEVKEFTDDDIALLKIFAAQAVIAIENVRQFRELQTRLEREAATGEVLGVISQSRDDEAPVFDVILENAARLCRAPHAFLQLRNEADTHLEVAAQNFATSRFLDRLRANPIPTQNNPGSISVLGMNSPTPTHYDDVALLKGTDLYTEQLGYAIDDEGMGSAVFVPLISDGRGIGVIVLYKLEVAPFSADEISLVRTFAAQAVIAIENVKQFKALEVLNASLETLVEEQVGEIERMGRLKRFLPAAVADTVVSQGADNMLKSHRALLGVLFCDIRGFTAFCETAEPEETIEVLQTYHEEMGKLIVAHGAGVDHRMGDGIMVLFNDPVPCEHPAGAALGLAMAMRVRMAELCKVWKRLGHRLGFGVGVSLGYATVGMIGYEGRYDYTASGSAVNLAARLCDHAEDGEILLSPRAYTAVEDECQCEPAGQLELKGLSAPVDVMKAIALHGDAGA